MLVMYIARLSVLGMAVSDTPDLRVGDAGSGQKPQVCCDDTCVIFLGQWIHTLGGKTQLSVSIESPFN